MKRPPWDVCPVRDCDNPAVWSNPGMPGMGIAVRIGMTMTL